MKSLFANVNKNNSTIFSCMVVGISVLWFLLLSCFFPQVLIPLNKEILIGEFGTQIPFSIAALCAASLGSFVLRLTCNLFTWKKKFIALQLLGLAGIVGTGLVLIYIRQEESPADVAFLLAGCFYGTSLCCLTALWMHIVSRYSKGFLAIALCVSMFFGAAEFFFSHFVEIAARVWLVAFLVGCSIGAVVMLNLSHQSKEGVEKKPATQFKLDIQISILDFFYYFAFGAFLTSFQADAELGLLHILIAIPLLAAGFGTAAFLSMHRSNVTLCLLQKISLPVIVLGLIVFAFNVQPLRLLSLAIAIFVLSIYHASVIDSLTALIRKNNLQPFYIAGRTMAPNMIAAAMGCTIALISATLVEPGSLQSNIVMGATMFVVLALLLCFAFAPLDTDWLGGAEAGDADDVGVLMVPPRRFQNTLDEIASAHNLSHRETEIFLYVRPPLTRTLVCIRAFL